MNSTEGQALDDLPTTVLYDIFRDAATALGAIYLARGDHAATAEESIRWWDQVLALRDTTATTDPDDRPALTTHIQQWQRLTAELQAD